MEYIAAQDYDEMSRIAAGMLAEQLRKKPDSVFALPTGSTPIGTYAQLSTMHEHADLNFSEATFFNVDEYVGMRPDSPQGYAYFLWKHLYSNVNVNVAKVHAPDGLAADPDEAAEQYQQLIEEVGGLDVAFLGLGRNGHVGFNEPAPKLPYAAHCVTLTPSTVEANARFFSSADEVPRRAITIGIGTIMQAGRIILIAQGADKREAVLEAETTKEITTEFPVSLLKLHHNAVMITAR